MIQYAMRAGNISALDFIEDQTDECPYYLCHTCVKKPNELSVEMIIWIIKRMIRFPRYGAIIASLADQHDAPEICEEVIQKFPDMEIPCLSFYLDYDNPKLLTWALENGIVSEDHDVCAYIRNGTNGYWKYPLTKLCDTPPL